MPDPRLLDARGLLCPLPILLGVREMKRLAPGDHLEILGDDPGLLEDLPVWCERAGHRLVEMAEEDGGVIRGLVEKGKGGPKVGRATGGGKGAKGAEVP